MSLRTIITEWMGSLSPRRLRRKRCRKRGTKALERLENRQLLSGVNFVAVDDVSPTGEVVTAAVVADFNGDGRQDLAFAAGNNVSIRWGDVSGDLGGLQSKVTPDGRSVVDLIAADLTGNGRDELLVKTVRSIDVLEASAGATPGLNFTTHIGIRKGGIYPTTVVDFSADGRLDIVTGTYNQATGSSMLRFVRNEGPSGFKKKTAIAVGASRLRDGDLYSGDITANGRNDVVLVNRFGAGKLFRSTQRGIRKNSGSEFDAFENAIVVDINNDGRPDHISRQDSRFGGDDRFAVTLGKSDGGFRTGSIKTRIPSGDTSTLDVADANGDGFLDAFTRKSVNRYRDEIVFAAGDGTGRMDYKAAFSFETSVGLAKRPHIIALGDLNNDGRSDLIVRDAATGEAVIIEARPKDAADLRIESIDIDKTVRVSEVEYDLLGNRYSPIDFNFTIENDGNIDAGFFTTQFYLSTDAHIDPSEDLLVAGYRHLLGLDAGESNTIDIQAEFPAIADTYWTGEGRKYFFGTVVDLGNQIEESSESNNSNQSLGIDVEAVIVRHTYHGPQIHRRAAGVTNEVQYVLFDFEITNIGADGRLDLSTSAIGFSDDGVLHDDWEARFETGSSVSLAAGESTTLQIRVWKIPGDSRDEIHESSLVSIGSNALNLNPLKFTIDAGQYFD